MKLLASAVSLINLINHCFDFVIDTSAIYKIDESHALKHSMEVYGYAKKIYDNEVIKHPYLENQQAIIYSAAIAHDMCDKKYMVEKRGHCTFTSAFIWLYDSPGARNNGKYYRNNVLF